MQKNKRLRHCKDVKCVFFCSRITLYYWKNSIFQNSIVWLKNWICNVLPLFKSSGQGWTMQFINVVELPMQYDPLKAGAGFVQERLTVWYPVPQICWEHFVIGTQPVQFPLTVKLKLENKKNKLNSSVTWNNHLDKLLLFVWNRRNRVEIKWNLYWKLMKLIFKIYVTFNSQIINSTKKTSF